jgi:hypothetical protein
MRWNLPRTLAALAFVSAMAIGTAAPSVAQGVYFEGPGVEIGVGPRWHHRDYYYDYGRPYHRYWRHHYYDWD